MKRLTALLALFLLLTLLAQGACAALKISLQYVRVNRLFPQDISTIYGQVTTSPSVNAFQVRLSSVDTAKREAIQKSFDSSSFCTDSPESGYLRHAVCVDMGLWYGFNGLQGELRELMTNPDSGHFPDGSTFHPVLPLSAFIPEGTTFKNLRVFHAQTEANPFKVSEWESVKTALHTGDPKFNSNGIGFQNTNVVDTENALRCRSDHMLRLSVGHFSPFVIVWDELDSSVLSAIESLPPTGDSSSLAPWLLLLGGACVLLLAKKKSAASA